jgi:hypothetical protein
MVDKYGYLSASETAGMDYAQKCYETKVMASDASRKQFAGVVSTLSDMTPVGRIPFSGSVVESIANNMLERVGNNRIKSPNGNINNIYDTHSKMANDYNGKNNDRYFLEGFERTYNAELAQIQYALGLNKDRHHVSLSPVQDQEVQLAEKTQLKEPGIGFSEINTNNLFDRMYASVKKGDESEYQGVMGDVRITPESAVFRSEVVQNVDSQQEQALAQAKQSEINEPVQVAQQRSGPRMG